MYLYYGEEYEVPKKEHFILRVAVLLPIQDQPQVYCFLFVFIFIMIINMLILYDP